MANLGGVGTMTKGGGKQTTFLEAMTTLYI